VLIYPLIEEVFYRGILFSLFRRYVPMWLAVSVPTAIFALTHVGAGPANVGFALLVGLYFSWLVVRSGSLLVNVLCHGAINLFVLFVMNPIWSVHHVDTPADFLGPLPLTMLAGSLALFVYGVRILRAEFNQRASIRDEQTTASPAVPAAA
jgi:membrane protease YdiL (CAAX protease family)